MNNIIREWAFAFLVTAAMSSFALAVIAACAVIMVFR